MEQTDLNYAINQQEVTNILMQIINKMKKDLTFRLSAIDDSIDKIIEYDLWKTVKDDNEILGKEIDKLEQWLKDKEKLDVSAFLKSFYLTAFQQVECITVQQKQVDLLLDEKYRQLTKRDKKKKETEDKIKFIEADLVEIEQISSFINLMNQKIDKEIERQADSIDLYQFEKEQWLLTSILIYEMIQLIHKHRLSLPYLLLESYLMMEFVTSIEKSNRQTYFEDYEAEIVKLLDNSDEMMTNLEKKKDQIADLEVEFKEEYAPYMELSEFNQVWQKIMVLKDQVEKKEKEMTHIKDELQVTYEKNKVMIKKIEG